MCVIITQLVNDFDIIIKKEISMFVQLLCKDRNQKEKDELYQVLSALAHREQLQIEERGDIVELDVCPQGKIQVSEEDRQVVMYANTRHGGPGFHAFCVDLFLDIQHELSGDYELIDDLDDFRLGPPSTMWSFSVMVKSPLPLRTWMSADCGRKHRCISAGLE